MSQLIIDMIDSKNDRIHPFIELLIISLQHPLGQIIWFCIALWIYVFYRHMSYLLEPTNYKLDMTTKKYCKKLAEVDNSLKVYRQIVTDGSPNQQKQKPRVGPILNSKPKKYLLEYDTSTSLEPRPVNGWIPLLESSKVKPGSVRRAVVFGKDLIVTRSDDGKQVNVLDAYCPHAGVNIGIGGSVKRVDKESCVQCPFHGWVFRASDGECVEIPYQKKKCIPIQAKLNTWPCLEVDNFIYIWHHLDNDPPNWSMVSTPELMEGKWTLAGRSCHVSNLDLEYMQENGADLNHFSGIHEDLVLFGNIENLPKKKYMQNFIKHCWEPTWKPIRDGLGRSTHMAQLTLRNYLTIFGFKIFELTVVATQIGPARVKLFYDSKWVGRGMLTMNSIPIGGRRLKYIQHVYTGSSILEKIQGKIVLYGEIKMTLTSYTRNIEQLERDLTIWNHKKYLKNPIVVPEDKTVKQFRMWYSQFYRKKIKITPGEVHNSDNDLGMPGKDSPQSSGLEDSDLDQSNVDNADNNIINNSQYKKQKNLIDF